MTRNHHHPPGSRPDQPAARRMRACVTHADWCSARTNAPRGARHFELPVVYELPPAAAGVRAHALQRALVEASLLLSRRTDRAPHGRREG